MSTLNHKQRRVRRRQMAKYVNNGKPLREVAALYGVSVETVRKACREYGVDFTKKNLASAPGPVPGVNSFRIIAALLNTEDNLNKISSDLGISRQRVQQIYYGARSAGILIKTRGKGRLNGVGG